MYVPEIEISIKFKGKSNVLLRSIKSTKDAHNLALEIFNADQIEWVEEFIMLSLNRRWEVIGFYRVSKGGTTATIADPKVIAMVALQSLATHVIIMHNHPSGGIQPSEADKYINLLAELISKILKRLNSRFFYVNKYFTYFFSYF